MSEKIKGVQWVPFLLISHSRIVKAVTGKYWELYKY